MVFLIGWYPLIKISLQDGDWREKEDGWQKREADLCMQLNHLREACCLSIILCFPHSNYIFSSPRHSCKFALRRVKRDI